VVSVGTGMIPHNYFRWEHHVYAPKAGMGRCLVSKHLHCSLSYYPTYRLDFNLLKVTPFNLSTGAVFAMDKSTDIVAANAPLSQVHRTLFTLPAVLSDLCTVL